MQPEIMLHEQREWLRVTLASIGDAVIASDRDGRVTFLNPEAERLTGWSLPEAQRQALADVFHIVNEESRKRVENPAEKVLRLGHVVGLANHTALIARNGAEWPIADSAAPIRDHEGNVLGVVLVFREIADLRRAEQQARSAAAERERLLHNERASRSEAERANRVKDDFVAMVSHELRTPLNAILGWIELLKRQNADPALLARGLEVVGRNTRLQAQLISDLLDVSRIASGKLQLELEAVHLDELVEQSIESFQPAAAEKGVNVEVAIARPVPAMLGDPGRLQQVAWNLLSNAIKFTPRGGNISVRLQSANDHIELTVSDSGIGIRPVLLPNIFDRFRQGAAMSTRRHGGLGLGLSIIKHLVALHGGSISAWSDGDDQGAAFTVELPLRSADQRGTPRGSTELATTAQIADGVSLDGIKILVVEDDPDTRDLVRRLLESYRAQVTVAASAPEALELMRTGRMDMLLSDIGLPDMDGYDLIRAIRQPGGPDANMPAIALTAFARAEDRTRALRAGFNAHVAKPVDPNELIVVVGSFLSLISSQRTP
jgi:PAS domain S-box-containing protein